VAQATKQSLTGARRAAIVIASLPRETAAEVLSRMGRKDAEAVGLEIARLAEIPEGAAEEALREFLGVARSGGAVLQDGLAHARELLRSSLPETEAGEAVARLEDAAAARRPFDFLAAADADVIISQIAGEHPQTVALVLSHLPAARAAGVLAGLPVSKQGEVVRRISRLHEVSPEALKSVEESLAGRLSSLAASGVRAGGVERAADLLRRAGSRVERSCLEALEDEEPDLADDLRKRLFAFEDLLRADDRGIRSLLKEVSTQELSVALKTASEELRERFLANMSRRARELLADEMEYMRPVRLTEVEASQMRILDAARRLEEAGELFVAGRASGEDYVA
jgi:flagellar motor switch protein FliG